MISPTIHKIESLNADDYPPLPPDEDEDELKKANPERRGPQPKDVRTLLTVRGRAHTERRNSVTNLVFPQMTTSTH
jgi:hypothetical protein